MIRTLLALIALMVPIGAQAEWREASSPNFVVYSSGSEQHLRESIIRLERFHFILRAMHGITRAPSPVRLKVYLMRNVDDVAASLPYPAFGVNGYYENNARGPFIVGTRMTGGAYMSGLDPEIVLQHEYAHHFMFSYFPATYPTWYTEGFAEFWGTTRLLDDDVFEVGLPSNARLLSLGEDRWMPLDRILAARTYDDAGSQLGLIYAEGWLLLRYLFENRERRGQLERYLNLINRGVTYEEAMNQAFGEGARALNAELRRYSQSPRFNILRVPFRRIEVPPITVRTLRPAEEALLGQEIRLGLGVLQRHAADFATEVRGIASRYPDDPYALAILAEAEMLTDRGEAARAALDRLLAIDPNHARALAWRGQLQVGALRAAGSRDEGAWTGAREPIRRAIQLAPDDPVVLEAYYDSFVTQGVLPPAGAQNALFRALTLAPGDSYLRQKVAADFEQRGMIEDAVTVIKPAAFAMRHGSDESERERRRRERAEERFRMAGRQRGETPREMLTRLEALLAAQPRRRESPLEPEREAAAADRD